MPIYVTKHPLEQMELTERIKILRFPSILGRDIINQFRLVFDHGSHEVFLEK